MKNSYWDGCGLHQHKADLLQKLIPPEGSIETPDSENLEQFRRAVNCYYGLYNDGIRDYDEFSYMFVDSYNYRASHEPNFTGEYQQRLYDVVEEIMDQYVLDAFEEQLPNILLGI